ncbi:hypothetical protein JCM10207_009204 [Rhodosporidiobolus poonsookiae]
MATSTTPPETTQADQPHSQPKRDNDVGVVAACAITSVAFAGVWQLIVWSPSLCRGLVEAVKFLSGLRILTLALLTAVYTAGITAGVGLVHLLLLAEQALAEELGTTGGILGAFLTTLPFLFASPFLGDIATVYTPCAASAYVVLFGVLRHHTGGLYLPFATRKTVQAPVPPSPPTTHKQFTPAPGIPEVKVCVLVRGEEKNVAGGAIEEEDWREAHHTVVRFNEHVNCLPERVDEDSKPASDCGTEPFAKLDEEGETSK